jgi:hypothetical protein
MLFFITSCSSINTVSYEEDTDGIKKEKVEDLIDDIVVEKEDYDVEGDVIEEYVEEEKIMSYVDYDLLEDVDPVEELIIVSSPIIDTISFPPVYRRSINNEIEVGDINYVVNDTMVIGVTTEVNMTISHNVDIEEIINDVETFNEDNVVSEEIRIAPVMRAKLIDPSGVNFRIIPTTNEEQFLEDEEFTLWTWNVTPLLKGDNELELVVDIIIDDRSKSIQVFDGVIYVYSDDSILDIIIDFINNNWTYLLSTLIIPLFLFFYKKGKNKKKCN